MAIGELQIFLDGVLGSHYETFRGILGKREVRMWDTQTKGNVVLELSDAHGTLLRSFPLAQNTYRFVKTVGETDGPSITHLYYLADNSAGYVAEMSRRLLLIFSELDDEGWDVLHIVDKWVTMGMMISLDNETLEGSSVTRRLLTREVVRKRL